MIYWTYHPCLSFWVLIRIIVWGTADMQWFLSLYHHGLYWHGQNLKFEIWNLTRLTWLDHLRICQAIETIDWQVLKCILFCYLSTNKLCCVPPPYSSLRKIRTLVFPSLPFKYVFQSDDASYHCQRFQCSTLNIQWGSNFSQATVILTFVACHPVIGQVCLVCPARNELVSPLYQESTIFKYAR